MKKYIYSIFNMLARPLMLDSFKKDVFIFAIGVFFISAAFAQQTSKKNLSLKDMSAFKPQAGNWFVVKDVTMNQAVTYEPGSGILLNMKEGAKNDNLITNWEHGDIELELEVMLPKGSNSGIYLQGRYELQLFDSWGVKSAKFTDIGGIYREGGAPLTNAAKAPGLWQSMKISFRAPRFNQAGEKIANARFVSVELNGVKIQDNAEVPSPTGGAIENNEKPMGPLMIQGDHGQVALRNIKYRLMQE